MTNATDTNEPTVKIGNSIVKRSDLRRGTKRKSKACANNKAVVNNAKQRPRSTKVKDEAGNTFTTVDIAAQQGINAKTLRARIRRNIDKWAPLFKDGENHVFADNATTRKAVAALLDA